MEPLRVGVHLAGGFGADLGVHMPSEGAARAASEGAGHQEEACHGAGMFLVADDFILAGGLESGWVVGRGKGDWLGVVLMLRVFFASHIFVSCRVSI